MTPPNSTETNLKALIKYWPLVIFAALIWDISFRMFQNNDGTAVRVVADWKKDRAQQRLVDSLKDINKQVQDSIHMAKRFKELQDSLKVTMLHDVKSELIKAIDGNFVNMKQDVNIINKRLSVIEKDLARSKGYIQVKKDGKIYNVPVK